MKSFFYNFIYIRTSSCISLVAHDTEWHEMVETSPTDFLNICTGWNGSIINDKSITFNSNLMNLRNKMQIIMIYYDK